MNTQTNSLNAWDKIMMAITFAEADEAEIARQVIEKRPQVRKENTTRPELRV